MDIIYDAASPKGWALIEEPSAKELRFCKRMDIEIIEAGIDALLTGANLPVVERREVAQASC